MTDNGDGKMRTLIKRDDNYFVVSTCDTFDAGWETMVFACDADGENIDFHDLYSDRYRNIEEAMVGHKKAIEEFQPPVRVESDDYDASRHDYSDDAEALASAGYGTDEDYGYNGDD